MPKDYLADWIIIGISGVTCGGKTTLSNKLKDTLAPVYVFHQDRYFYPDDSDKHVKCEHLDHNNYDILSALNMEGMYKDVLATLKGDVTRAHATYKDPLEPADNRKTVTGKKFLILEGFTLLNYEPLADLCTLKYYLVLDFEECVRRRCFRLYDPPDIAGYFEQCVWPEHLRYRAELEGTPGIHFLDGTSPTVFETVMEHVDKLANKVNRCTLH